MQRAILSAAAFILATTAPLHAQSIAGTWQGTLSIPNAQGASVNRNPRIVFTIEESAEGSLKGGLTFIDFGSSMPLTSVTISSPDVAFAQSDASVMFRGKLSADGQSIAGTWTQGPRSLPLTLQLAGADTVWKREGSTIPPMAADADPSYDVATIKPATADEQHPIFNLRSHNFTATGTSAKELIKTAWNIRGRQVIGGPPWLDDKKFDIVAEPDTPGLPSEQQSRVMVHKLLTERFHLVAHSLQQPYPVLALTLDPTGPPPTPSDPKFRDLNMFGQRDGDDIVLHITGATISQMLGFIMNTFQARQLVDETGLTGTYNITLRIEGLGQGPVSDEDFGTALVQAAAHAGFKFVSKKEPLTVVVIDHIDPPTPN